MKIIGNTVGTTIPKPNLMQTDPKKGDFVKGKEEFIKQNPGVYIGSGEMPEGYNIQIDPDGDPFALVKTLLISILRNAVFTSDQSAYIDALESAFGGNGEVPDLPDIPDIPDEPDLPDVPNEPDAPETVYSVSNNLSKVTTSNSATSIIHGSSYNATLTPDAGHQIKSVMVSMSGSNITSSAYSNGKVTISSVTGPIVIVAIATDVSNETRTETLEVVPSTTYPNNTTFEYTENATASQYVVAKKSTLTGGTLTIDYNTEEANGFNMILYLFDTDGNPYKYHGDSVIYNGETTVNWSDPAATSGFGTVNAPATVTIPSGCTVMACMRRGNGQGTQCSSNATFAQWACNGGITFTLESEEIDNLCFVETNLTNVNIDNPIKKVNMGTPFNATLTAKDGYTLDTVLITMGGVDITASIYDNGAISIPSVTGNIVITAIAVEHTVQTETVTKVWSVSYPNITTFEFTESATQTGAQGYICTRQNSIKGGLLSVDFDDTIVKNFQFNMYIFDADGNPYKQTNYGSGVYAKDKGWGVNEPRLYGPGIGSGFGCVSKPFTYQLPEGCTFITCMRKGDTCDVLSDTVTNTNFGVTQWIMDNVTMTVTG